MSKSNLNELGKNQVISEAIFPVCERGTINKLKFSNMKTHLWGVCKRYMRILLK